MVVLECHLAGVLDLSKVGEMAEASDYVRKRFNRLSFLGSLSGLRIVL